MSGQADLFAPALPDGLTYIDGLIDADQEAVLTEAARQVDVSPFRFQGWTGKRQTASFGWHYDFDDASFAETEAIPDWLIGLRAAAASVAGLDAAALLQVLVSRYDPGAGIGWHRDRPQYDKVLGLSLSAACVLRLRRRIGAGFERRHVELPPRSLYLLAGEVRREWEHSIVPTAVTRRSITLRTLR
jgi:alkylated DNA repair dioxygenase AlkB